MRPQYPAYPAGPGIYRGPTHAEEMFYTSLSYSQSTLCLVGFFSRARILGECEDSPPTLFSLFMWKLARTH